jgi:hypothetical protein
MRLKFIKFAMFIVFSCAAIFYFFIQSDFSIANALNSETDYSKINNNSSIALKKLFFNEENLYFEIQVCRKNTKKYAVKAYIECVDEKSNNVKKLVSTFYLRKDGCYNFNFTVDYDESILNDDCSLIVEGLDVVFKKEIEACRIDVKIFEIVQNGDFLETTLKIKNNEFNDFYLTAMSKLFSDEGEIDGFEKVFYLEENSERLVLLKNILNRRASYLEIKILKEDAIIFEGKIDEIKFIEEERLKEQSVSTVTANNSIKLENNSFPEIKNSKQNYSKENAQSYAEEVYVKKSECKTECNFSDYQKLVALYTFLFLSVALNIILIIKR